MNSNRIIIDDDVKKNFGECDSLNKLAINIQGQITDIDVLIIFVNLKFSNYKRADQKGIELLIWLRLKGVMNHCVLCSFETLHSILNKKPNYLIATSVGTTFAQLPIDVNEIDINYIKDKTADIENLKLCLKSVFDTKELKHRLANIYGLWFLFCTHNRYFGEEELDINIFPTEFRSSLNGLQLEISKFFIQKKDISSDTFILKKISELKEEIARLSPRPKILYIDDKADLGWGKLLKKIIFKNDDNAHFDILIPSIEDFENPNNFTFFNKRVSGQIYNNNDHIDCVFLDLRLADEMGEIMNLNELSGIKLLKEIHRKYPSLPIIITTASNKAESVKKILELGADALWSKPGLDDIKNESDYLSIYLELLQFTIQALSKYSSDTEKFIKKAQFELSNYNFWYKNIPDQIKGADIVMTDTMFWCQTDIKIVKNQKVIFLLVKYFKSKFVIIEDILDELIIHSKKNFGLPLGQTSDFSIGLIQKYKKDYHIQSRFEEVANAISLSTIYKTEPLDGGGFNVVSSVSKIHSYHKNKEDAEKDMKERRDKKKNTLHADDTFKLIIPYYLKKRNNLLFVSEDTGSKMNIFNSLRYNFQPNNHDWVISKEEEKEINKIIIKVNVTRETCCIMISPDTLYELFYNKKVEFTFKEFDVPYSL